MGMGKQPDCDALGDRVRKRDLFACLALWMEQSPTTFSANTSAEKPSPSTGDTEEDSHDNKSSQRHTTLNPVGVVIADSADNIVSLDSTRDPELHGVQSALIDSHGRLERSAVYVSRKPCSSCAKLMILAGVSHVFFLPFEPENCDDADMNCVDRLFRTCAVEQSIYQPDITEMTIKNSKMKPSPYTQRKNNTDEPVKEMMEHFWNKRWRGKMSSTLKLSNDHQSIETINERIERTIRWIGDVTLGDVPDDVTFQAANENRADWLHLTRMAQMLSQRSDDPRRGVGAVIKKGGRIVAVGWNGYPPKAQPGDFPTASHRDEALPGETKYPFSIHAEQSAILRRNTREISDDSTTIFVSKEPCDECAPLLVKTGIKNVVYPRPASNSSRSNGLTYELIREYVGKGQIRGFETVQPEGINSAIEK